MPFAAIMQSLSLFQKLIDVDVGINQKIISKISFEKQNLSKFLKKSKKKSDISQLLIFLSNIIFLQKCKELKTKRALFILNLFLYQ